MICRRFTRNSRQQKVAGLVPHWKYRYVSAPELSPKLETKPESISMLAFLSRSNTAEIVELVSFGK